MPRALISVAILALAGIVAPRSSGAAIHEYKFLALSPDGVQLAAVEPSPGPSTAEAPRGPIVIRRTQDGGVVSQIDTCRRCQYSGLAWSPDGTQLAFVASDVAAGQVLIDIASLGKKASSSGNRAVTVLASFKGVAGALQWSPDGSQVAVLATVNAKKQAGALEAGAPQVGEIGESNDEQRIAVLPKNGGSLRFVSPDDRYVYEFDWTPDSNGFVATTARGGGDNNWWIAELQLINLTDGRARSIAHPDYQITTPRVAPDGKSVVFIGGVMSDFGAAGGDIYEVPIEGGAPVNRTPGFRGSFGSLLWRNGDLYAAALAVDQWQIVRFGRSTFAPKILWSSPVSASTGDDAAGDVDPIVSISSDGTRAATVVEDFGRAPVIIAGTIDAMHPITTDNDANNVSLNVRSVTWTNDHFDVQGWLVGPAKLRPTQSYPLIVQIHGGPGWESYPYFGRDNEFHLTAREWAARGYFVFLPNYRGSFGQGEAFTRANVRDFGGGDFRDILAGLDTVLKSAPIDAARVGIFGHSYGGYMTMWAVTHTHRFKAAVAGAGIANWMSYYGQNGIDQWMIPFFGSSAYDDPVAYRAASPIEFIKEARTPTLIYVGELDVECPAPQSFEFWHALKAMGVPTQLVVYPGAGHWFHKPEQVRDVKQRIAGWFDRYLSGDPNATRREP